MPCRIPQLSYCRNVHIPITLSLLNLFNKPLHHSPDGLNPLGIMATAKAALLSIVFSKSYKR